MMLAKKSTISLAWNASQSPGTLSYLVEWTTKPGGAVVGSLSVPGCFCTLADLEPGDYFFSVMTVAPNGQRSIPSNVVPCEVTEQIGARRK